MDTKEQVASLVLSVICNQSFDEFYNGMFEEWIIGESELSGEEITELIKEQLPVEWPPLYTEKEPAF